jgi:methyl-accepting chemotaxis protein
MAMTYELNLTEFQLVEIQHALYTLQSQYNQTIDAGEGNDRLKEEVVEIDEILKLISNITEQWVYATES